ncbi:hypothetical protein [Methylobacterium fujisawaense]|uniref:hypothetical protein n=1 Tax=Methylobacterium fujisawaense TaxID=107400 RepID=UPI00244828A0|nr:hypothetical protein [Methylobacterium fujisawaense]MDH3031450.1 hypothetical protein [Methylobacterium fujisawaense]
MSREHPVIRALRETTRIRPADLDFIAKYGRSYTGAALPPGVRRWPLGECVPGAEGLEARGLGRFITGFVLRAGTRRPIPHSWASPDGFRALDPTLVDAKSHAYWGLADRRRGRVNDIVARAFKGTTSAGLPVDLMRGGLKIPGLRPFRVM